MYMAEGKAGGDRITIIPAEPIQRHRTTNNGFNLRKTFSRERTTTRERSRDRSDVESTYDQEFERRRSVDYPHKQVYKGWPLFLLAFQSAGVIYGDIGTSPLYVFSSTFYSPPNYDDLLGALSIIIWTLTLIVTIKYVVIVLNADNEGQGGTFAMYSLLTRYGNIGTADDPSKEGTIKMERYKSTEIGQGNLVVRNVLEKYKGARFMLSLIACFGVSLIISDGVLTPAQSILGAVQGLNVVVPDISQGTIIGVTCAILIFLFAIQPFGVARLGSIFAPIVIVWLLFNFAFGVYNLAIHDASVLKAFSPYFAGLYFVRNGTEAWKSMGGLLLAFTGVEALFADLGAFSKRAIQISWLGLAYPCLLMAYIGQAAYISLHPNAYSNPFFNSAPPGTFWPAFIVSILAAIVASQALITSTFQLLFQVINMSYFPPISYRYTSVEHHSQIFIPMANWALMIGTIVVTAVFKDTTKLGNAYGVCVILDTTITTTLVSLVAVIVWRIKWYFVIPIWFIYATFEGLYMTSAMIKVPDGAWFTLALAFCIVSVFTTWRFGKERQWRVERKGRMRFSKLVTKDPNLPSQVRLNAGLGGGEVIVTKGIGIFFDKSGGNDFVPQVYEEYIRRFEAQPMIQVFLHLRATTVPFVPESDRYAVTKTGLPNAYRMVIRYGYAEVPVSSKLGNIVYNELKRYIVGLSAKEKPVFGIPFVVTTPPGTLEGTNIDSAEIKPGSVTEKTGMDSKPDQASPLPSGAVSPPIECSPTNSTDIARRLNDLDTAHHSQTLFVFGKEKLRLLSSSDLKAAEEEARLATTDTDLAEDEAEDFLKSQSLSQRIALKRIAVGHGRDKKHTVLTRFFLGAYLWMRDSTGDKVGSLRVPMDRVVEIGFVKDL